MVHTSEHHKEQVIKQALFEAFAFKPDTTRRYYKPLSKIKNYSLLARVIKELGREKADNSDLVISTELINTRFWAKYNEEKYKNNANAKCCFCLNTGTITSFVDEYGNQVEWKKRLVIAGKVTESMLICECGKGDNIVAKSKDIPDLEERRRYRIKYGMTVEDIMRSENLKKVALGYFNHGLKNKADSLSEKDYLYWFKKWYIEQCWESYRKQQTKEVKK